MRCQIVSLFMIFVSCQGIAPTANQRAVTHNETVNTEVKTETRLVEKVTCMERDSSVTNSEGSITIKQCTFLDYRTVIIGEADNKGRYSYDYKLQRKIKNGFEKIENSSMFIKQKELLNVLNAKLAAEYSAIKNNPEVSDCLEGKELRQRINNLNDFQIEFTDSTLRFNYSLGLSGACFNVDGAIIDVNLRELRKFIQE